MKNWKRNASNPVDKHMQMAAEFEVKDTPFIISKKATLTQAMSLQRNWQKLYVLNKLIDKDF